MGVSDQWHLEEDRMNLVGRSSGWIMALAFTMMLVVGLFYSAAGLVMPDGARNVVWVMWLGMLAFQIRLRDRTWLVLTVPLATLILLVAVVSVGDILLDWSA